MPGNSEIEKMGCLEGIKHDLIVALILLGVSMALVVLLGLGSGAPLISGSKKNSYNPPKPKSSPSYNSDSWFNPYTQNCTDLEYLLKGRGCANP